MGPLFPLLFLALCIIVVVVIAVSIKDKKAKTIFGVSVGIVVALISGLILFQMALNESPEYVFRDTFDIDPPTDVSSIQGEISAAFDFKETWLYFKASRRTVNYLVVRKGLSEVTQDEALREGFTNSDGAPSFWKPSISVSAKCYTSAREHENGILIFNEQEGEVFFRSSNIQ